MHDQAHRPDNARLLILILAGGEGDRIGGEKPFQHLGGSRLIDHALSCARQYGDEIAVSVRQHGQIETELPAIVDAPELQGPLAGLTSGLAEARAKGMGHLLLLPTDTPFLPADLLEKLALALRRAPQSRAALARSNGRIHPVCSLWRSDIGDALSDYSATGRRSLIGFAEAVGFVCADWEETPDPFFNVNTGQDLEVARQRLVAQNGNTTTSSPEA